MPIPANAVPFSQPLDPGDVLDFLATLAKGAQDATPPPILLNGESVGSMQLVLTSEAAALGLKIVSGSFNGSTYPAPAIDANNVLSFWLGVDVAFQSSALFQGQGTPLGIDLIIRTNNTPPRVIQRTIAVTVQKQGAGNPL